MNYTRLAPFYQSIEKFTMGGALQRARTAQLARLAGRTSVKRALIVGEGDGSFLLSFARQFPEAEIIVVEPSEGMVRRAQARLKRASLLEDRIVFVSAPLLEATLPHTTFDLIVTLFFFDNFENVEVAKCIAKLEAGASEKAYWLLSDFCIPSRGWRRLRAQLWLWVLYRFFWATTGISARRLPDTERLIKTTAFSLLDRQSLCGEMLYSSLYRRPRRSFRDAMKSGYSPIRRDRLRLLKLVADEAWWSIGESNS